jgi:hypothetical protein
MNRILMFVFAACVAVSAQTITSVTPRNVQVGPASDLQITITGKGLKKPVKLGMYTLKIKSGNQFKVIATVPKIYLQSPAMWPVTVGNSNSVNLQVCSKIVITTTAINLTVGVPIGPEGQIQATGGCLPNP